MKNEADWFLFWRLLEIWCPSVLTCLQSRTIRNMKESPLANSGNRHSEAKRLSIE